MMSHQHDDEQLPEYSCVCKLTASRFHTGFKSIHCECYFGVEMQIPISNSKLNIVSISVHDISKNTVFTSVRITQDGSMSAYRSMSFTRCHHHVQQSPTNRFVLCFTAILLSCPCCQWPILWKPADFMPPFA